MRGVVFALLLAPALAWAQNVTRDGITLSQAQETRAEALGGQFRCLVCQNESIEESGADLARQLRVIIREEIVAGASDKDITNFLVARYGSFVLLKPPVEPATWPLYATPPLAVLGGLGLAYLLYRRKRVEQEGLSAAERAKLDTLLDE